MALVTAFLLQSGTAIQQQQTGPATSATGLPAQISVPHSPHDLLKLALNMNGVDVRPATPWHIKLSYDEFDEDGDNVHSGSIEEFVVSAKKYKRVYSGDTLNQIDFASEQGLYRAGDQRWPSPTELQVRNEAFRPLYRVRFDDPNTKIDRTDWQIGATKLPCVIVRRTDLIISDNGLPKFCFDPGTVMLRYTRGRGWDETTYNNIVWFQQHYLARDVTVTQGGTAFLKIHIDQMESLSSVDEAIFTPPANSSRIGARIALSAEILMGEYLVSEGRLRNPRTASGKVNVNFVVGKDGRVIQADAIDGPEQLRKAALDAMRGYRFRPFLVLDEPVEVESKMSFRFN